MENPKRAQYAQSWKHRSFIDQLGKPFVRPPSVQFTLNTVNLFFHAIFTQRDVHNVNWNSLHLGGN